MATSVIFLNRIMKTSKVLLFFGGTAALMFSTMTAAAQTPPPTNGAPIDAAAGALLLAVAAYGYIRLKKADAKKIFGSDEAENPLKTRKV